MMKNIRRAGIYLIFSLGIIGLGAPAFPQAMVIDHTCIDLSQIPEYWLEQAKGLTLHYAHTSHGGQITSGIQNLEDLDTYYSMAIRNNSSEGLPPIEDPTALRIYDGNPPETYISPDDYWEGSSAWARTTAIAATGNYDFSMWSWCGQVSSASESYINEYLETMDQFETWYPGMRFIYMTGHLDGTVSSGTLHQRNEQIRDYCTYYYKVLFDFADIERYDPDGVDYLDLGANDDCDYSGGNWANEWCTANPGSELCEDCYCAHSRALNCNQKARAFWWMMARLAGWDGQTGAPTPFPTLTPVGGLTPPPPPTETPTISPSTPTPPPAKTPTVSPPTPTAPPPQTITPTPPTSCSCTPTPAHSPTPTPIPESLLNPSFELDPPLVDWTKIGISGNIDHATGGCHGTFSCIFRDPTMNYYSRGIRSAAVSVIGGNYYDFCGCFYVLNDEGGVIDDTQFQFLIEWRNTAQTILSTSGTSDWNLAAFDTWEEKSYTNVQAPEESVYVTLYIAVKETINNNNDAYIDNFSLNSVIATPSPTPEVTPMCSPCTVEAWGSVYDGVTLAPIENAYVELNGSDWKYDWFGSDWTDQSGSYHILGGNCCGAGSGTIVASFSGYQTGNHQLTYGCANNLDFFLDPLATSTPTPWSPYTPTSTPTPSPAPTVSIEVEGQVIDALTNNVIEGARVYLRTEYRSHYDITNSTGNYWFLTGGPTRATLSASSPGYHVSTVKTFLSFENDDIILHLTPTVGQTDGDYDGDGTADIAVFRKGSGLWAVRAVTRLYFGISGDLPVAGDYDGDGTTNPSIFRDNGLWAIRGITRFYFGSSDGVPGASDYNGDGIADMAFFRAGSGLWAVRSVTRLYFGASGDIPVAGDYDGDGTAEEGIYRPSTGLWAVRGVSRAYFGGPGDLPVPAGWSGSGIFVPAVFRPQTGLWAAMGLSRSYFGTGGDEPVSADFDGDGTTNIAIFRGSSGLWALQGISRLYYGTEDDIQVTR